MAPKSASARVADRPVQNIPLAKLLLDPENPRFGDHGKTGSQEKILEQIVTQFGIDDVLASLAVNGYFKSEPIVARADGSEYVVVEGNRRLAASLILGNDPRAESFSGRRPSKVHSFWSADVAIPVLVFQPDEQKDLLPYLGVRHIVGSQAWDSYAKARWVNEVLDAGAMTLDEISDAIGDSNRTVFRMLDGYRFVNQLREAGRFSPEKSRRRGRGSNPEFPFSWVYTLLGHTEVRATLGLPSRADSSTKPVSAKNLPLAGKVLTYLFGDDEHEPAIRDSRQIGDLADAISDPVKRDLLASGKTVEEIIRLSRSASDQLAELLRQSNESLRDALGVVTAAKMSEAEAEPFVRPAQEISRLAREVFSRIKQFSFPDDDADS